MAPETQCDSDTAVMSHANQAMKIRCIALLLLLTQSDDLNIGESRGIHKVGICGTHVSIRVIAKKHPEAIEPVTRQHVEVFGPVVRIVQAFFKPSLLHCIDRHAAIGHRWRLNGVADFTQWIQHTR